MIFYLQQTGVSPNDQNASPPVVDEIASLRDTVIKNGLAGNLLELQRLLLDTRQAKLLLLTHPSERNQDYEPVPYYYSST